MEPERTHPSRGSGRPGIFICYRRHDTAGHAGRLYDRLSARFGSERIFIDVDKIGPGVDFVQEIERAVGSSGVLLALIGREWVTAEHPGGQRRLDDPQDFVRLEIAGALGSDLLVIPLLVEGASMPLAEELPEPLRPLARRNAIELASERFDYDVGRIVEAVEAAFGARGPGRAAAGSVGEERAQPSEERKVVTILSCDLIGSAASTAEADPEDLRAAQRRYHTLVRREIERFGGTLDGMVGDSFTAVFGAPGAHEDDPERAVRAALRILEAVPDLPRSGEAPPAVRIGATTGEAVVSLGQREEGESIVTGAVVNAATRISAVAPAGAVLVGEATYRATRHVFNYAELQPMEAGDVLLWQALSARSRYATGIERPTTPFIDREDDFALLRGAYAKALHGPSVQLVTITGEPGVGKSRLLGEFSRYVDDLPDLVRWREGRCLPYGEGITFWALGEIVKAEAGILESDGAEEASAKLSDSVEALIPDEQDREWLKARLGPLVGLPATGGPANRDETFTAWRRYLEAMAGQGPLVLVVEDVHAADPAMLDFIEELVEHAAGVPLLLIAGARPELYELRPNWGGGVRGAMTISLDPLSDPDCARLVSALLDQSVLPAGMLEGLLARAGGNPLYAEEFVRMLSDKGFVSPTGRLTELPDLERMELPAGVQALIAARVDTLSPERKALLQDASVMGRVFWAGAVATMEGRDERGVRLDLHELARMEFVRQARSSTVQGEVEYSLWHGLIGDVCYGQIPRAQRGRKHQAAAAWIESLAGERVADHAEFLAHHYGQALDLARASGEAGDLTALQASSLRFLVMAGERAMSLDVARAEAHYRRALDLAPPGHLERGPILARLGEALFMGGSFDGSESACREAVQELRATGRLLQAGEAMRMLALLLAYGGDVLASGRMLTEAIEILESLPPGPELVRALSDLAYDRSVSGAAVEGLAAAERALQVARDLEREVDEVRALPRRGTALTLLGDPRGVDDFRSALTRGLHLGLGRDIAVAHNNLGEALWAMDGPRAALESYREGAAFSEGRGMVLDAYTNRASSLGALLMSGAWDEVLSASTEVVDWLHAAGATLTEAWAAMWRAHAFLGRGEWSQAAILVDRYLPRVRDIGDLENLLPAIVAAAILERGRGDIAAALVLVREFGEVGGGQGTWYRAQFLPELVRICSRAQRVDLGESLLEGVPEHLAGHRLALFSARARLAEARGDPEVALGLHAEASEALEGFGWAAEEGHAILGQCRCLIELGRSAEATSKLQQAREIFTGLGARPVLEEIDGFSGEGAARIS